MTELLIVLMMAFNLWMVIYLTWERREDNKAEDGKGKDCEMKGMPDDIVGKSRFRMAERKPQAATMKPNAATDAQSEDVDEKDVTFADETPERHPRQVPDGELDEVFADSRVSDMAEYDEDEEYDGEPHEAGGLTKSSEATRRKLNELMDFYMDSVSAAIRKEPTPTAVRTTVPNVPDNIEDFNIRDFV